MNNTSVLEALTQEENQRTQATATKQKVREQKAKQRSEKQLERVRRIFSRIKENQMRVPARFSLQCAKDLCWYAGLIVLPSEKKEHLIEKWNQLQQRFESEILDGRVILPATAAIGDNEDDDDDDDNDDFIDSQSMSQVMMHF